MKKLKKITIFISIFIFLCTITSQISKATEINMFKDPAIDPSKKEEEDQGIIDVNEFDPSKYANLDSSTVTDYSSKFLSILTTFGIIVAVISLMILGLKFIIASPSEKAQYKETLVPIVVGIVIISSIISILSILAQMAASI